MVRDYGFKVTYRLLWYDGYRPQRIHVREAFMSAAEAFKYSQFLGLTDFIIDLGEGRWLNATYTKKPVD